MSVQDRIEIQPTSALRKSSAFTAYVNGSPETPEEAHNLRMAFATELADLLYPPS